MLEKVLDVDIIDGNITYQQFFVGLIFPRILFYLTLDG